MHACSNFRLIYFLFNMPFFWICLEQGKLTDAPALTYWMKKCVDYGLEGVGPRGRHCKIQERKGRLFI